MKLNINYNPNTFSEIIEQPENGGSGGMSHSQMLGKFEYTLPAKI